MTPNVSDGFDEDSGSVIFFPGVVTHADVFDRVLTDDQIHYLWTGKKPLRPFWRKIATWLTLLFGRRRKERKTFDQTIRDLHPIAYWKLDDDPRTGLAIDSSGRGNHGGYHAESTDDDYNPLVYSKTVVRRFDKDGWHDVEIEKGELE
jgi:hypothetical protein